MSPPVQTYLLSDPDLLRRLMQRTGDGRPVSIRGLAEEVGCSSSHIHNLLAGRRTPVAHEFAVAVCRRVGVDLLVLFTPTGRTVPAEAEPIRATA